MDAREDGDATHDNNRDRLGSWIGLSRRRGRRIFLGVFDLKTESKFDVSCYDERSAVLVHLSIVASILEV